MSAVRPSSGDIAAANAAPDVFAATVAGQRNRKAQAVVDMEDGTRHHPYRLGCILFVRVSRQSAVRLAKPDSAWARKYYAEDKMKIAQARFPRKNPK